MTRILTMTLGTILGSALSLLATGAEKSTSSKAHSFLQVGNTYRFVTDEPDFRVKVLEVANANWVRVARLGRRGECDPHAADERMWLNLDKVNLIQGLASEAPGGSSSNAASLPFLEVGRTYRFARFSEDGEDHLAKVVSIPNANWIRVERIRARPAGPAPKAVGPLWLNLDAVGSITVVSERNP